MSSALSDDQVINELRKMEAFIKKEAEEKSKEIRLKADEEYEIEKSNIVRSETSSIDKLYEQKLKKSELEQQITKSTIANKTRLKILAERENILEEIYAAASKELKQKIANEKVYKDILQKLILEGLCTLLESSISLIVKEKDVSLIQSILPSVVAEFEKMSKIKATIEIQKSYLDENTIGGVIIVNGTGKIEVNNTLEERLELLSKTALPAIRLELFGPSKTRRFFE